jgi:hypothetical protein
MLAGCSQGVDLAFSGLPGLLMRAGGDIYSFSSHNIRKNQEFVNPWGENRLIMFITSLGIRSYGGEF